MNDEKRHDAPNGIAARVTGLAKVPRELGKSRAQLFGSRRRDRRWRILLLALGAAMQFVATPEVQYALKSATVRWLDKLAISDSAAKNPTNGR